MSTKSRRRGGRAAQTRPLPQAPAHERLKGWLHRRTVAALAVLSLVLIAGLQAVFGGGLMQVIDTKSIADWFARGPAVRVTYDEPYFKSVAFESANALATGDLGIVQRQSKEPDGRKAYADLLRRKNAAPVGHFHLNFGLEGRRQQTLRVQNVRAVVHRRTAPLAGTLLCNPSAGGNEPEVIGFDMDEANPAARKQESTQELGALYFNVRTVTLQYGEVVAVSADFWAVERYTQFSIAVDVVYGGNPAVVEFNNRGKDFAITGYAKSGQSLRLEGLRNYSSAVVANMLPEDQPQVIDPQAWRLSDNAGEYVC